MQSFENRPMSPTKRPGVSKPLDTGYKAKSKDASPPQTPSKSPLPPMAKSNIAAANRALKVRTEPRETFLDDVTPVDPALNKENDPDRMRGNRDSHDLSLSPRQVTRDSLVDHMLLSLDQFSFGQRGGDFGLSNPTLEEEQPYSTFGDEESYQPAQNFAPQRNGRGTMHSYSYSSDYDNADDNSRYSSQFSRGRRSNSSSNIPSGIGRLNSIRSKDTVSNPNLTGSRFQVQVPPRKLHSRSGKGSKASSANSLDLGYAQVTGQQRWAQPLPGRSSSFDYGNHRQSMSEQLNTMGGRIEPYTTFTPYDYDAAPTPTVPVGPRRLRPASPILPQDPMPEPGTNLERKRSSKSSKSAYKGRTAMGNSSGGRYDYGLNDRNRELPSLPAFNPEPTSAPAPLVGYGKAKEPLPSPVQQPKEKPGFFRRVFGSSKTNPSTASDPPRSHGSTTSPVSAERLSSIRPSSKPQHIANQIRTQNADSPPPREPPPPPQERTYTLTKKPSSFFRRRKKSVSEPEAPVPVPIVPPNLRLQPENTLPPKPSPSPVSSLRKVMNPYLRSPEKSPLEPPQAGNTIDREVNGTADLNERNVRGFSPDYQPDKNATIRTIKPSSKDSLENFPSAYEFESMANQKPLPNPSAGISKADQQTRGERDVTFLQDSSDNGDEAHSSNLNPALVKDPSTPMSRPFSPPASVARDRALVSEYERVHSKRSPTTSKPDMKGAKSPPRESSKSVTDSRLSQIKGKHGVQDEQWVVLTPKKSLVPAEKDHRVWLEPSSSEEDLNASKLSFPAQAAQASARTSGSTDTGYKSAISLTIEVEGVEDLPSSPRLVGATEGIKSLYELQPGIDARTPTEGEREKAKKIYDGNEDFIQKEKAAAWMGEEGAVRSRTLLAYMELYDFANLNILAAMRILCGKLVLKGESQQVDRILDAFAKRWCQCNPNHGFKVTDVVHTICYSILLLNTDLHLADIDQKMTRSQFVKNTMPTIRRSVADSAPDTFEPNRPTVLPGKSQAFAPDGSSQSLQQGDNLAKAQRSSLEIERPSWRASFKPPPRADSDTVGSNAPTPLDYDTPIDDCGPLVKAPFNGTLRTWEVQVEIVLKDFYNSIRNERLPLFGAVVERSLQPTTSSNTLAVFANGMLRRTPSVLSRTPSEAPSYARGRTAETMRTGNGKWTNKNRSRPRPYPNSGLGSSRTSLDDQSSIWSPSVSSSTWSKYSLGKTQTSMSVDSMGSGWPQGDYQQSIGFANALSQAIIREETIGSVGSNGSEELRVAPLLEDESLELAGAPWAKEGIVKHKYHLESVDKKSKDRNWNEQFAVIEKGYMSLFSFSSKSMRNKTKGKVAGGVVGGGNWQENAESLGSFLLRQTIASALPSPGYSKARPHVWALSLPTGAVHLFQVGTPDIVKEFVSTANYWSARLSNHPLVGGISNVEYGWSDEIVNNSLVTAIHEAGRPSSSGPRPSLQNSQRPSLDQGGNMKARLPGDKIMIADWTPPTQSMRASNLMEQDQLKALQDYVADIEEELQKHNQLRNSMLLAFTPRHPNAQRAMANWERKSSYLLREIVKFRTYIDCLLAAEAAKKKIYKERATEKALAEKVLAEKMRDDENFDDGDGDGDTTLRP